MIHATEKLRNCGKRTCDAIRCELRLKAQAELKAVASLNIVGNRRGYHRRMIAMRSQILRQKHDRKRWPQTLK